MHYSSFLYVYSKFKAIQMDIMSILLKYLEKYQKYTGDLTIGDIIIHTHPHITIHVISYKHTYMSLYLKIVPS